MTTASDGGAGGRDQNWRTTLRDRTLPVSALVGVFVGLGVFVFERLVTFLLDHVRQAPLPVMVLAPGAGLALTALVLRIGPAPRSRATGDE